MIIVKEAYFKQVISDINHLCYSIKNNNTQSSAQDLDSIMASKEEQDLTKYLMGLTDTTLNTICAMMDFGRHFNMKVLPINLTAIFNKSYLPYWFDKNKDEKKEITAYYLSEKGKFLSEYLKRAEKLLFSKDIEIQLKHECGGHLIEIEGSNYPCDSQDEKYEYDEEEYELNLECLKCGNNITKIVDRNYFKQQI